MKEGSIVTKEIVEVKYKEKFWKEVGVRVEAVKL